MQEHGTHCVLSSHMPLSESRSSLRALLLEETLYTIDMNDHLGTDLISAIHLVIPECVPAHGQAQFIQGYLENVLNVVLARYPEAGEFVRKTYVEQ